MVNQKKRAVKASGSVVLSICLTILAGLLVFGVPCAPAAQFEIKLGHADPPDIYASRKAAGSTAFKNMVESETGGAIKVNLFPAGQLGGERELAEGTKLGTIQMSMLSGPLSTLCPEVQVFDIPYLFPSYTVAWKVLDGPFGKELAQECLKKTGIRILTYSQNGFRNFTNSVRPIKSPADLKGLKIRVMESPVYLSLIKSMGGSPTPMNWPEVYTALQQKVVDGQETPVTAIKYAKLYEVQKYMTLDKHTFSVSFMLINEKFFQSLPKEFQAIVQDAARTSTIVENGIDTLDSSIALQFLKEKGMEVYAPSEAEKAAFRNAGQKPTIEYLEKQVGRTWVDKVLKAVKVAEDELKK